MKIEYKKVPAPSPHFDWSLTEHIAFEVLYKKPSVIQLAVVFKNPWYFFSINNQKYPTLNYNFLSNIFWTNLDMKSDEVIQWCPLT